MTIPGIIIVASSLDGRISPTPLGSSTDRQLLERMRDETDASLIGSGTLRAENPQLQGGMAGNRLRAVISGTGRLPLTGKLFFQQDTPAIIFTSAAGEALCRASHGQRARIIVLPQRGDSLDLGAAFAYLEAEGATKVLIEGGGKLNYQALQQDVVDELLVTITPQLSADAEAASLALGPAHGQKPPFQLELLSCKPAQSGEIFTHYKVIKAD